MTVYIYGLHDPRDNALRYIGKTVNLRRRFLAHIDNERSCAYKNQWALQLKALGLRPVMRVLETIENSDDLDWQERERWWIKTSRANGVRLTNLDEGGNSGNRKSEETRRKLSIARKGRKHSQETIAKMCADRKGHPVSEECRRKLRAAHIGMTHSEESRRKIREARARQIITPECRRKLSEAFKGRRPSPQTIAASVARTTGVPQSEEHRAKHRAAKKRSRQACILFGLSPRTAGEVRVAQFISAQMP